MKIALSTQTPARLEADLVVAVLDPAVNLFEADDSRLGQALRRAQEGFRQEKYRRELFQTFDENENVKALLVFSTSLSKSFDLAENVKIAAAKALSYAADYGLSRVAFLLNHPEGVSHAANAVWPALLISTGQKKSR